MKNENPRKFYEKIDKYKSPGLESLELPSTPTLPKFQLQTRNKQSIRPHQRHPPSMKSLTAVSELIPGIWGPKFATQLGIG